MTIYRSQKKMRSKYSIHEDSIELSVSRLFRNLYIIPVHQFAHSIDFTDSNRWRTMQRRIRTNDSRNISFWGNRRIHLISRPLRKRLSAAFGKSKSIFIFVEFNRNCSSALDQTRLQWSNHQRFAGMVLYLVHKRLSIHLIYHATHLLRIHTTLQDVTI